MLMGRMNMFQYCVFYHSLLSTVARATALICARFLPFF
jgi:hypothetical protein